MHYTIVLTAITMVATAGLVLSACSAPNSAPPIPTITASIATSLPPSPILPTLTPLPVLPSATATFRPSATLVPIATPSPQLIAPTQTQPPPTVTPVVLPQLPVFDKDGNNMEGKAYGTPLATTFLSFQVVVCEPDCKTKPDGNGVSSVEFSFYKGTTKSRNALDGKTPVYKWTEQNHPYCAFGGGDVCPKWIFAEHGNKWPNGSTIDNGDYTLLMKANGKNNGLWTSVLNFTIRR